jgi:hypothetical protein
MPRLFLTVRCSCRSSFLSHGRCRLTVGWFEAIAAGELERTTDSVLRFTGTAPLTLEDYRHGALADHVSNCPQRHALVLHRPQFVSIQNGFWTAKHLSG